jgi:hypothetical protein
MQPLRSVWRTGGRLLVACIAVVVVGAACSTTPGQPAPKVGGIVSFDENATSLANGTIPKADPYFACGSTTEGFGTELLSTSPNLAHVRDEWGDVIPGQQMYEVGTVRNPVVGHGGDLPFTHPFGDDLTFDLKLDQPYAPLSQTVGTAQAGADADLNSIAAGSLHTEIPEGLLPQGTDGSIQPDFVVKDGDRVAAYGPWIVDCGHTDFHTEIHPTNFVAFGQSSGSTTTAQAVYNPYTVTQLFNPKLDLLTDFSNDKRFSDPLTQAFPKYVYGAILRLAGAGPGGVCCADQLQAHMLIDANRTPGSVSWYVCAPQGTSGALSYSYKFTVRPGVSISATPDEGLGCVKMTATIGRSYAPMVPDRRDCSLSWDVLTQQASAAVGSPLDVKAAIEALAPASLISKVEQSPIIDCYQMPADPPPGGDSGQKTFVSNSQPFPFYGVVEVSRKS